MKESICDKRDTTVISVDDIQTILNDYRIGKKPLAKLLGWGETTIIRYIEGDVPTNEYSDKLKAILNNPAYYYEILVANKDNLTGVAYKKSKKAVLDKLMGDKINVVAQYIVNISNGDISATSLQTLLYYVQAFSLAIYDKEMFEDDYVVSIYNIPFVQLHEKLSGRSLSVLEMNEDLLTATEQELIKYVYDSFSWYGCKAFKSMTSYERTLLKISRDKDNNRIISKETLRTYFKEIMKQYNIVRAEDIYRYPDSRIVDIRNLA